MEFSSSSGNNFYFQGQNYSNGYNYTQTHNMIRWKSGKRIDPRLLSLLESYAEIYTDRRELFEKIFDGNYEELFSKIGFAIKKKKQMKKARSMPRSVSMRANGNRGIGDEIDGVRLERFKVRTPNVIVDGPEDGQSGQGQTAKGSKDSK